MNTALELELEEDIALLPSLHEVSDYERERGKPMPNEHHSFAQSNLISALNFRYKKQFRFLSELSIVIGDRTPVPDISVYPRYSVNWSVHPPAAKTEPPLLAIEIISPSQTLSEITDKAAQYFAHGVKSCWIVQPELQTISVLHPGEKPRTFDSGLVEDNAIGIELPIEEVFE